MLFRSPTPPGIVDDPEGSSISTGPPGTAAPDTSGLSSADPNFRLGGLIPKRGQRSDPTPITAHEGEFVVDEDSTAKYLPELQQMNREKPRGLERLGRRKR